MAGTLTKFAYVADGWTSDGERLDATVFVVEDDGRLRRADEDETREYYRRYGTGAAGTVPVN